MSPYEIFKSSTIIMTIKIHKAFEKSVGVIFRPSFEFQDVSIANTMYRTDCGARRDVPAGWLWRLWTEGHISGLQETQASRSAGEQWAMSMMLIVMVLGYVHVFVSSYNSTFILWRCWYLITSMFCISISTLLFVDGTGTSLRPCFCKEYLYFHSSRWSCRYLMKSRSV